MDIIRAIRSSKIRDQSIAGGEFQLRRGDLCQEESGNFRDHGEGKVALTEYGRYGSWDVVDKQRTVLEIYHRKQLYGDWKECEKSWVVYGS